MKKSGDQENEDIPVTTDDSVMTSGAVRQEVPEILEAEMNEAFIDAVPQYLPVGARDTDTEPEYVEKMKKLMPEERFSAFEWFPDWRDGAILGDWGS